MYFDDIFRSYWWLLFPIGFFVFGAWDRWLVYKRSRDHLELIKTYAAQGKEPPPELVKAAQDPMGDAAWNLSAGPGAPYPPYGVPAYPAPVAYQSCNNALVGGLIGAAAGTLIGAGAGSHYRDGGAAAIMGLIGGAAVGTAVGAASCD